MSNNGKTRKQANGRIQIRKVDYDALARESGENAYRRAKDNGLPEETARKFRIIMSAPIPAECRFS